ncbi:hypothetical protein [Alloacidobacterium sp.]|uniref:hypothetical protein n=1 Tax=Alloacidobacterium sp. TaxID=2951999 RepID=UPI002D3FA088|nr:hypothetical protein [Alloacidobacterium sp.]HYK36171.1 hypothetical protein [Alloacidobacterium sp.]
MAEDTTKLFATRSERYPQPSDTDKARDALEKIVQQIPVLGPATVHVIAQFLVPGVERRREEWFKELADDFDCLKEKVNGFIENLAQNEAFVTATIQATRIAIGTHQADKRRLLRNALLNIATSTAFSEDMQHIYLQWIEEFTSSHVKILHFLWTAVSRLAAANGGTLPRGRSFQDVLDESEPDFRNKGELTGQILNDLKSRGLVTGPQSMNFPFPQQVVTNQGGNFLQFVLRPEDIPNNRY